MGNTIKQGYMVQVNSWENDGDASRTVTLTGLSEETSRMLHAILPHFASVNDRSGGIQKFGNCSILSEDDEDFSPYHNRTVTDFIDCIETYREKYPNTFDDFMFGDDSFEEGETFVDLDMETKMDAYHDALCGVLGYAVEYCEPYFFRVFDGMVIHYIDRDIEPVIFEG